MNHSHSKKNSQHGRSFAIGIGLNVAFVAVEVIYGIIANSSALLADAGHNASDVLSLVFAWGAIWLASKKPGGRFTFGFRKTTILVSLLNAMLLFGAVVVIAWHAVHKLKNPEPVAGGQVMIVAGIGVVINSLTALLFMRGQKNDLNIKGAFLHMAADAAVSAGVIVSGLLILKTGKLWIDPAMSFVIVLVILRGTWKLFTESVNLALDAVPEDLDINKIRESLNKIDGVNDVHDLHIWAMSTTENSLSAHVISGTKDPDNLLAMIRDEIRVKYGLDHLTIQIESAENGNTCIEC